MYALASSSFLLLTSTLGCTVAQLRVIFKPDYIKTSTGEPLELFAYIQPFKITRHARGTVDANIKMYRLERELYSDRTRKGLVVLLKDIWRPVELVPRFGKECNTGWTCDTAVEEAKEFYLNCFSDKATYIEVY